MTGRVSPGGIKAPRTEPSENFGTTQATLLPPSRAENKLEQQRSSTKVLGKPPSPPVGGGTIS